MPSPTSASTTTSVAYLVLKSCECEWPLTSIEECSAAAQSLDLSDTTATDDGQSGKSYDPPGCYFESSSLKFNADQSNTGDCKSADQCICKSSGPSTTSSPTSA